MLGAFTTFSTFSMETMSLLENGEQVRAGLNVVLSVILVGPLGLWGPALGTAIPGIVFGVLVPPYPPATSDATLGWSRERFSRSRSWLKRSGQSAP